MSLTWRIQMTFLMILFLFFIPSWKWATGAQICKVNETDLSISLTCLRSKQREGEANIILLKRNLTRDREKRSHWKQDIKKFQDFSRCACPGGHIWLKKCLLSILKCIRVVLSCLLSSCGRLFSLYHYHHDHYRHKKRRRGPSSSSSTSSVLMTVFLNDSFFLSKTCPSSDSFSVCLLSPCLFSHTFTVLLHLTFLSFCPFS